MAKILLLHDLFLIPAGGHHQYAMYLLSALRKNHQVRFSFEPARNKVFNLKYPTAYFAARCLLSEASWIILRSPSIVIVSGLWNPEVICLALLSILLGKKLVVFPHGMASRLSHKKSLLGWAIRSIKQLYLFWLFRSCSFIIASSQSEAQSLSQAFNILSKIKVLAPSALYYPLPKETNLASRFSASQFTARASQFNILCAGRHTQEKGSAFLRKVWEKYSSISTVPTSLFVVGPIGDCSAFLRSLESYSCVHSVIVDDSFYDLCDIPALAQYCQISISPSPYESFGMSIYESLSSGLPVISSTGTPWSNLNKYNAGAWVTWDILAYLEKLLFFSLLTKSHLEHYSANARQLALDSHRFASKSLSCFQSLL